MFALIRVAYEMDSREVSKEDIKKYIDYYFEQHDNESVTGSMAARPSMAHDETHELDESADELIENIMARHKKREDLEKDSGLPMINRPTKKNIHDIFTGFVRE